METQSPARHRPPAPPRRRPNAVALSSSHRRQQQHSLRSLSPMMILLFAFTHTRPHTASAYSTSAKSHNHNRISSNTHVLRTTATPSSSPLPTSPARSSLAALARDLVALRRKFESELDDGLLAAGHQVELGSACSRHPDCQRHIKGSHCSTANFTCTCLPQHVALNGTTCLPAALLGFDCQLDEQCQLRVPGSECSNNNNTSKRECQCKANSVAHRRDKCLLASKINDYCLSDRQCQLADNHSLCKWRIAHIYGTCKCPPNYLEIATAASGGRVRCVPRLGDVCLSDEECLLATANSRCLEPQPSAYLARLLAWPSSAAASARRCLCAASFRPAASRLTCERVQPQSSPAPPPMWPSSPAQLPTQSPVGPLPALLADEREMNANHQYELVVINSTTTASEPPPADTASPITASASATIVVTTNFASPSPKISTITATSSSASASMSTTTTTTTNTTTTVAPDTTFKGTGAGAGAGAAAAAAAEATTTEPRTKTTTANRGGTPSKPPSNHAASHQDRVPPTAPNPPPRSTPKPAAAPRMSSLGKPCTSDAECQLRDKHSRCSAELGVCECVVPTSVCGANSTGCHADTFQCRNGQCVSWYFVCDNFRNCDDGSDEDECHSYGDDKNGSAEDETEGAAGAAGVPGWRKMGRPQRGCPAVAFQCDDGRCLARAKLCDGKPDCADSSDERLCNQPSAAAAAAVAAGAGADSTRTGDRQAPVGGCPAKAFQCANGQCLPGYVLCNAVEDCADGSDEREQLCEPRLWAQRQLPAPPVGAELDTGLTLNGSSLAAASASAYRRPAGAAAALLASRPPLAHGSRPGDSPLVTADRAAIDKMLAALNLSQRTPAARGQRRHKATQAAAVLAAAAQGRARGRAARVALDWAPGECPRDAFTCSNGRCRSTAILCSGVDGCGDRSDEERCEVCMCAAPD